MPARVLITRVFADEPWKAGGFGDRKRAERGKKPRGAPVAVEERMDMRLASSEQPQVPIEEAERAIRTKSQETMMQFPMRYPLSLSFKIVAMAPQLSVTDANGVLVAYIKQKLFKLKEDVTVFEDEQKLRAAFNMKADRVIDFSPRFQFFDQLGQAVGAVKRQGRKSLWRAHFDVTTSQNRTLQIREENPWVKVWDGLLTEIPIVGMFSGYLLHPAYLVTSADDRVLMRMKKQPAFFEGKFSIEKQAELSAEDERAAFLSLMMVVLMERIRG